MMKHIKSCEIEKEKKLSLFSKFVKYAMVKIIFYVATKSSMDNVQFTTAFRWYNIINTAKIMYKTCEWFSIARIVWFARDMYQLQVWYNICINDQCSHCISYLTFSSASEITCKHIRTYNNADVKVITTFIYRFPINIINKTKWSICNVLDLRNVRNEYLALSSVKKQITEKKRNWTKLWPQYDFHWSSKVHFMKKNFEFQ